MIVCGLVGLKNSGKTYIAQKLINYFVSLDYKIATIKHAHHEFDIDQQGTDSFLHRKSGSTEVIVSSSKRWAKIVELKNEKEKKLKDLLADLNSPDIVIVEGFKNDSHPKIEIIKENSNEFLYPKLDNIVGIISDKKIKTTIPQFQKKDIINIAQHILKIK